ncbi:MAG TPA: hypothetical protein PLW48_03565 [Alphaproteobacteria bacterium]|mgnify:CR=1 FL=1|nr:hypothetical protein [Alphaproteobacteria bacterium]
MKIQPDKIISVTLAAIFLGSLGAIYFTKPAPKIDTHSIDTNDSPDITETAPSALAFDLTGNGVSLSKLGDKGNAYWKADPDSPFAQRSAWMTDGTGFLAFDINANGYIDDNTELFGTFYNHGFEILAIYDSNDDKTITNEDQIWSKLRIWVDKNKNGFSDAKELHTLDSLLISSINLSYTKASYSIADNEITHESTFVINGNTNTLVNARLTPDIANTMYVKDYAFNPDVWSLPNLRGYGKIADLGIAMCLDGEQAGEGNLISLVTALANKPAEEIFDGTGRLVNDVRAILFRWAGVDDVAPNSRGKFVDAQELAFLEKITGKPFRQNNRHPNPTGPNAGGTLSATFNKVFNQLYADILIQTPASHIFANGVHFDVLTGKVTNADVLNIDVLQSFKDFARSLSTTEERFRFWSDIVRMIEYTVGTDNLDADSHYALASAIADSGLSLQTIKKMR